MNDEFLKYYNDELAYIRKHGNNFAEKYPKIASRLGLGGNAYQDPFVGRLVESFAFISGRLKQTIDNEHKEITESLLSLMAPHFNLPLPAASILQVSPDPELEKPIAIAKDSEVICNGIENQQCKFTTVYPMKLWPISLNQAIMSKQINSQLKSISNQIKSELTLSLQCNKDNLSIYDLSIDQLQFFINMERHQSALLYENLFNDTARIFISSDDHYGDPIEVPKTLLKPVGFAKNQGMYPYPENSFDGYRLLTEYFAFPEKFFFFDLEGLNHYIPETFKHNLKVHILFNYPMPELEKSINKNSFSLGATPIVNLFKQQGETIYFNQQQTEYQVIANGYGNKEEIEVYQVTNIETLNDHNNKALACTPYFGANYQIDPTEEIIYWTSKQRPMTDLGEYNLNGSDTFLVFSHLNQHQLTTDDTIILTPNLLCTNREMPNYIVVGGDKPDMQFTDKVNGIKKLKCLLPFTSTQYRDKRFSDRDLISHLMLNQSSFSQQDNPLSVLKQNLALYSYNNDIENFIDKGLINLTQRKIMMRHPYDPKNGICPGLQFMLTVDHTQVPNNLSYLFGSVLNQFLAVTAHINCFTQLTINNSRSERIFTWHSQIGSQPLL